MAQSPEWQDWDAIVHYETPHYNQDSVTKETVSRELVATKYHTRSVRTQGSGALVFLQIPNWQPSIQSFPTYAFHPEPSGTWVGNSNAYKTSLFHQWFQHKEVRAQISYMSEAAELSYWNCSSLPLKHLFEASMMKEAPKSSDPTKPRMLCYVSVFKWSFPLYWEDCGGSGTQSFPNTLLLNSWHKEGIMYNSGYIQSHWALALKLHLNHLYLLEDSWN